MILVATLLAPAAAFGIQKLTPERQFTASVLLFAQVAGDPGTYSAYAGGIGANSRMSTYGVAGAVLGDQRADHRATRIAAGAERTRGQGDRRPGSPTACLPVRQAVVGAAAGGVTGTDPQTTIDTVNTLASVLMKMSGELEYVEAKPTDPIQYTGPVAELVAVDPATVAHEVQPDVTNTLLVATGVGFALSLVLVLAFGLARDEVLTGGQLRRVASSATSSGDVR